MLAAGEMSLDRVLSMDIEWVLYHLVHNDPDFQQLSLDVDFYDDDVWSRLLASLSRNSTIESVKVERYQGGEGARSYQELADLFQALARIPSIENLTIAAVSSEDFMAARPLLRHENLRMCHLDWTGVESSGGDDFDYRGGGRGRGVPVEVGVALAEAPKLTELVLEDPPHVDCELWLSSILQSPSLKSIKVETYSGARLYPEAGATLFESLQRNSVLREFSLGYLLDDHDEVMTTTTTTTTTTSPLDYIAEMIRHNTTLKTVRLTLVSREEECYLEILDAFQHHNQTLSLFENYTAAAVGVSVDVLRKQQEMLEKNSHLEFLSLFRDDDAENLVFSQAKTMYLKLNAAGRKRLFHGTGSDGDSCGKEELLASTSSGISSRPNDDWINVMAETADSLDCLYYCLSMNPSLCKSNTSISSIIDDDKDGSSSADGRVAAHVGKRKR